jgi:hypothetical protein
VTIRFAAGGRCVLYLLQGGNKILIKALHIVSPHHKELQPMLQPKFCSQCGEKLKGRRLSLFLFTPFCAPCKKQTRWVRSGLAAILISLAAGSFLAGRATTPRPAFQFIGQPIELPNADHRAPDKPEASAAEGAQGVPEKQASPSPNEALSLCGATTKAGRPCRRKVRGSGYCWQHKDNFKAQAKASR